MKSNGVTFFCLFLLLTWFKLAYSRDCIISKNIYTQKNFPIILRDGYENQDYLLDAIYLPEIVQENIQTPSKEEIKLSNKIEFLSLLFERIRIQNKEEIRISNGKNVIIACPGAFISVNNRNLNDEVKIFECQNGLFGEYSVADIKCSKIPEVHLKNPSDKFQIGFMIKDKFLELISGHFNDRHKITSFTKHKLLSSITAPQSYRIKYGFIKPLFTNCAKYYTKNFYKRIIQRKGNLARGHLTPAADFNIPYLRKATYVYYNAVPQWQQINNANWKALENDVRKMAKKYSKGLDIYTGTSKLSGKELFLCDRSKLPIPSFMWKVVVDPNAKKAIAFVMSNNPYNRNESKFTCKNKCNEVKEHIRIAHTDCNQTYKKGCLYCCQLDDELYDSILNLPAHLRGYPLLTDF